MIKVFFYTVFFTLVGCNIIDNKEDKDNDKTLFKQTNWELIKLVDKQDTARFKEIIQKNNYNINKQEEKYGQTVLLWAVKNEKIKSVKKLLELGADPNIFSNLENGSALIIASTKIDTSYLHYLLRYNADPNLGNPNKDVLNNLPLNAAIKTNLINTKILLQSGANLYKEYFFSMFKSIPLKTAFNEEKIEIVSYVIFNDIIDIKRPLLIRSDSTNFYITHALRNWTFPLDSKEYKQKMEIVNYLKKHGMDYWKTEIPRDFYNNYPKEYLEKY